MKKESGKTGRIFSKKTSRLSLVLCVCPWFCEVDWDGRVDGLDASAHLASRRFNPPYGGSDPGVAGCTPQLGFIIMTQTSTGCSAPPDRKSTRLNSSHLVISYAVFCL